MAKPKKLNFELISEVAQPDPYRLLFDVRHNYHAVLNEAAIALAWHVNVKPDTDGHVLLGRCVKVSDLYREFAEFDFIIVLNREVWDSPEFDEPRKIALLDHELCHAAVAEDDDGVKRDERGRIVYRVRKHDIEEFGSVVKHHGCYKHDLEAFADLLLAKRKAPLFPDNTGEGGELTVSIKAQNPSTGQMETVMEPMPHRDFMAACEEISSLSDAEVKAYFRAHINDDPLLWPAGASVAQCERIHAQIQTEAN